MTYDIRPLSFGEILDRAFRVYRDNFLLLFGISAVMWIPSGIILATASVIGNAAAFTLYFIFLTIAAPIMQAALTLGIAEAYLDRTITISEAFTSVRPIFLPIVGTYLFIAVIFLVTGGVVGGVTYVISKPLFVVALIVLGVAAFYFGVCWSLAGPVMIVERRFGMAALRRSRELVVGAWWFTLGITLTASLIASVPVGALRFVWAFIPVIGVVLSAATQAVSGAYGMVAAVIYYFDRRCRTEDFDLRLLAEQVRSQSTPKMMPSRGSSSLA